MKTIAHSLLHLHFIHRTSRVGTFLDWLTKYEVVVFLLVLMFVLRLPNLYEPYWYGDEGIYLTIGNALRKGERLYADIIDHKTPIIYYLAMVPNQLWFRVLLLGWMTISTIAFYNVSLSLKFSKLQSITATMLFILLTSLPWLEGNIPNGELFVMGFVLVGLWILLKKRFVLDVSTRPTASLKSLASAQQQPDAVLLFCLAGVCLGLGILTKVPALFDAVGIGTIGLLIWTKSKSSVIQQFSISFRFWSILGMGVLIPILASISYYFFRGTLSEYFNFGLLYNFRYAGSWEVSTNPAWLAFFFTMQGKVLVLATIWILTFIFGKMGKLRPQVQFFIWWGSSAIFASLLSSRPYPHYLLQLVPPLALLLPFTILHKKVQRHKTEIFFSLLLLSMVFVSVRTLGFGFYPTLRYYQAFYQLKMNQISEEEYRNSFDHLMKDNYQIAQILRQTHADQIFIWGTNPTLYALSQTYPVGRFTASFHIKDFPNGFIETEQALKNRKPSFIILMKSESSDFPYFYQLLGNEYVVVQEFDHQVLFKHVTFAN